MFFPSRFIIFMRFCPFFKLSAEIIATQLKNKKQERH